MTKLTGSPDRYGFISRRELGPAATVPGHIGAAVIGHPLIKRDDVPRQLA